MPVGDDDCQLCDRRQSFAQRRLTKHHDATPITDKQQNCSLTQRRGTHFFRPRMLMTQDKPGMLNVLATARSARKEVREHMC